MSKVLKFIMKIFFITFLVILVFNVKVSNVDIVGNEKISDIKRCNIRYFDAKKRIKREKFRQRAPKLLGNKREIDKFWQYI